jgi:hypothetical protein
MTLGEGGAGFSLVLSLMRPGTFGCSPGTYPRNFRTIGRTSCFGELFLRLAVID